MEKLTSLINIGNEMQAKLNAIGIDNVAKFRAVGVYDTFVQMKQKFANVCLVHLQVLQGAYDGIEYNQLSKETKLKLKSFYDEFFGEDRS